MYGKNYLILMISKRRTVCMNILITGSNRGIGLALVKSFLKEKALVIAACRNPEKTGELIKLKREHEGSLEIVCCDVADDNSVSACAKEAGSYVTGLDILINNAAIYPKPNEERLEEIALKKITDAINTNTIGPMRMTKAFLGLLKKGDNPRVVNISSGAGSISKLMAPAPSYGYAISKAAMNMATRSMAGDLKAYGITVVSVSPGWVQTDMGGSNASISPQESAESITATVLNLNIDKASLWLNRQGQEAEWAW
ncbi:MAG: SDR family NAD(P)-dependent oxidoreductase [Chitinivibrionales bacterium]|nr:SDR family NAD(P)-dependent oxidoreductase [Chitinivibrionales bacterium]